MSKYYSLKGFLSVGECEPNLIHVSLNLYYIHTDIYHTIYVATV